ncbi:MAG: ribonuclease P protein component 4 [Candidatus Micrarchaeaceae archaeon]|jgi:ribonuclease P protein subunit RPR2|nr:RNAase P [Candidatus Micrarchaeota archaeon]HII10027.1 RNAase P [Candidatus Micrarchaeota archaeon]
MKASKSGVVREIAEERIRILYDLAKKAYPDDPELSKSYTRIIKQISRHYKITLSKEIKTGICKNCGSVLIPGISASVRLVSSKKYASYKCLVCGAERHIPY